MEKINLGTKRAVTVRKELAKKNKAFAKLSRKEQRVAIAKDVIAQIRAKKFVAASTYFQLGRSRDEDEYNTPEFDITDNVNADLSECIAQKGCTVCGIGSLFASAVLNHDRLKVKKVSTDTSDYYTYEHATVVEVDRFHEENYLRKWFDADQLELIESYFERHCCASDSPIFEELDASKRLVMIMRNIISNNGRFDPCNGPHSMEQDD